MALGPNPDHGRDLIIGAVRIAPRSERELHLDTDEADAFGSAGDAAIVNESGRQRRFSVLSDDE